MYNRVFKPQKQYISTSTILLATKLGRVVTYSERLPLVKSYEILSGFLKSRNKKRSGYGHLQYGNLP